MRVLVIEDGPTDTELLRMMLARAEGDAVSIEVVHDVSAGITHLKKRGADAVLLDLCDGEDLSAVETLVGSVPEVPVVAFTSREDDARGAGAVQRGAQDYLVKDQANGSMVARSLKQAIERKRAEKEFRESERRYRDLFDHMSSGVVVYQAAADGEDFVIRDFNASAERIERVRREDVIGRGVIEAFPGVTEMGLLDVFRRVWRTGELERHPAMLYRDERTTGWRENTVYKLPSGEIVAAYDDVTEREQSAEERRRLTAAIEQAAEPIVITDRTGIILYANPAFEQVTGHDRRKAVGRTPLLLKSGKHDQAFYKHLWDTIERGDVWKGEFTNRRKDGRLYEEEATISPVRDVSGRIVNYVKVARDVTQMRELEKRVRQSQKMEAIGRLAGGVAHDFNNLLTGIVGYTQLLLAGARKGSGEEGDLLQIRDLSGRATALTRQLLAFGRRQELAPVVMNLNDLVKQTTRMLSRLIGEDVELEFTGADGLWEVKADVSQMEQVLMNLAINARDAMSDGGKLTIQTGNVTVEESDDADPGKAAGDYVVLTVTDTGCGMNEETAGRVFEPFFSTKKGAVRSGLELSTVYGIVQQHGGHVEVDSRVGERTTFSVWLPRAGSHRDAAPSPSESARNKEDRETILLVEDEEAVRGVARRALEETGYTVYALDRPSPAQQLFEERGEEIDLLLTDAVLPEFDGGELYRRLSSRHRTLKALFMSGYEKGTMPGPTTIRPGAPFIRKPYTPAQLVRKVREVLHPDASASEREE